MTSEHKNILKIAVIAANGRSGKIFVEQALQAGHRVRAGVYRGNTLTSHPNLSILECNATSRSDLKQLLAGQDAVVSFIGHIKGSPKHVQSDAMRALVAVTQQQRMPKRIISLTGTGVRLPGDNITIIDRLLNLGITIVDPARVKDGIEHAGVLRHSDLSWTILRVLKLQDSKPRPFKLTEHGPTKSFVSRREVADAVLQVLEQQSYICKAPILSRG